MSSAYRAAMDEMERAGLGDETRKAIAQAQADKKAGIGPYKRPETDKTEIDKVETDKPEARKRWWRLSHII
jgi:DNA invertase Pin-like site-specific DNA recombinase